MFSDFLCKRNSVGEMIQVNAMPARVALNNFVQWILQTSINTDPKQVICIGYNNASFDDHFLMNHGQKKLDPDVFTLLRRKVFTADMQKMLKFKGKLAALFLESGGSAEQAASLHDALEDCRALAVILKQRKVSFTDICVNTRSLESVHQRMSNPLLKSGLITDTVAVKMPRQMTCQEYLNLTDHELEIMLKSIGLTSASIKACLAKRTVYVTTANICDT